MKGAACPLIVAALFRISARGLHTNISSSSSASCNTKKDKSARPEAKAHGQRSVLPYRRHKPTALPCVQYFPARLYLRAKLRAGQRHVPTTQGLLGGPQPQVGVREEARSTQGSLCNASALRPFISECASPFCLPWCRVVFEIVGRGLVGQGYQDRKSFRTGCPPRDCSRRNSESCKLWYELFIFGFIGRRRLPTRASGGRKKKEIDDTQPNSIFLLP